MKKGLLKNIENQLNSLERILSARNLKLVNIYMLIFAFLNHILHVREFPDNINLSPDADAQRQAFTLATVISSHQQKKQQWIREFDKQKRDKSTHHSPELAWCSNSFVIA